MNSRTIEVKEHVEDINIILPNGDKIVLQYRDDGGIYPSLDICFDRQRIVRNWGRDMEQAQQIGKHPEDFAVFQLWIGLDPLQPLY